MRAKRFSILLALMLFLTSSGSGQQSSYPFSSAKSLPDNNDPSRFEFSNANYDYTIFDSGRGVRKRGSVPRSFNLRLNRNDHLVHEVYHADYQGDLLLICEVSDEEYGAGFIVRLVGRTLRVKWKRAIPAFNVGPGLIDGKYAYVTAIGFIGKVDLNSGVYVWRRSDLYDRHNQAFNSFELPEVRGELVVFRETPIYLRKKQAVIEVERSSGKVSRVDH